MATSMSLSARVQPQCRHILQSTWCARPVCMQQPHRPGMTCLKETLRWWRTTYNDKICSKNRQLNALFTRQQKTRKREEQETKPWKQCHVSPHWVWPSLCTSDSFSSGQQLLQRRIESYVKQYKIPWVIHGIDLRDHSLEWLMGSIYVNYPLSDSWDRIPSARLT